MMELKRFRDPVYGYIEIDKDLIMQVVDTPAFQRLKNITQTSYSSLYSSAVHTRFAHSLGVYYLGGRVSQAFFLSLAENEPKIAENVKDCVRVFNLACLLHDVGHAPFSHTLEACYLKDWDRTPLHECLAKLTGDSDLEDEIKINSYKAAPHELMSAIVSLDFFSKIIPDNRKSFFVRCITGYKYTKNLNPVKSVMNCFIELLNSKVIDVDKLDYLLRDSYMTGYDTVRIDYVRLLGSVCAFKQDDGMFRIAFRKAAISVIENVVYAHDAERKWIQNHPVVKYEAYLIENAFKEILKRDIGADKIPKEALTEDGIDIKKGKMRLMNDSDVIFLMKNLKNNDYVREYYDRNLRRHPIWKTEAEFQAIFSGKEKSLEAVGREFGNVNKYLNSLGRLPIINEGALKETKKELRKLEKETCKGELEQEKKEASLSEKRYHVELMEILQDFADENEIDFDFLIIDAEQFNSGFRKPEFGEIGIVFPELVSVCSFKDVTNVLQAQQSKSKNFFYLYYKRGGQQADLKIRNLIEKMLKLADDIVSRDERADKEKESKKAASRLK